MTTTDELILARKRIEELERLLAHEKAERAQLSSVLRWFKRFLKLKRLNPR